jgi:hypothetical protein
MHRCDRGIQAKSVTARMAQEGVDEPCGPCVSCADVSFFQTTATRAQGSQYRPRSLIHAIPTCSGSAVTRGLTSSVASLLGLGSIQSTVQWTERAGETRSNPRKDWKEKNWGNSMAATGGSGDPSWWSVGGPRGDRPSGSCLPGASTFLKGEGAAAVWLTRLLAQRPLGLLASSPDICAGNNIGVETF